MERTNSNKIINAYNIGDYRKVDFTNLFNNNNPISIEIGCGRGHFISELARLNPDRNFLANEMKYKHIKKALKKADLFNLHNIYFLHGDIYTFIYYFHKNLFADIYINFPDPWYKIRHNKRRLMSTEFINTMSHFLCKKGNFFFVTDHREYFYYGLGKLSSEKLLKNGFENYTDELPGYPESLYEIKYRKEKRTIFHAKFIKN